MLSIRDPYLNAIASALLCLLISGLVLLLGYLSFVTSWHPQFAPYEQRAKAQDIQPRTLQGREFRPIDLVPLRIEGTRMVVEQYVNNQALLVSEEWVEADRYPFIRFTVEGVHRDMLVRLFWRRIDMAPGEYHYAELHTSGNGSHWHDLSKYEEWRGRVMELGIGGVGRSNNEHFVLMRDEPFVLEEVGLRPFSRAAVVKTIWSEWTFFEGWSHTSMNQYLGVPSRKAIVRPNAAFGLWLLGALMTLVAWAAVRRTPHHELTTAPVLATVLAMMVLAWAAQDSLRVSFRVKQAMDTHALYAGQSLVEKVTRTRLRCDQMRERMRRDCAEHPPLPHL